jgi:L-serine dehydratase
MALAGVASVPPFAEVVKAMKQIGGSLPERLRETPRGGLANTKPAREIENRMKAL